MANTNSSKVTETQILRTIARRHAARTQRARAMIARNNPAPALPEVPAGITCLDCSAAMTPADYANSEFWCADCMPRA